MCVFIKAAILLKIICSVRLILLLEGLLFLVIIHSHAISEFNASVDWDGVDIVIFLFLSPF
ncbi:uncharacterized protein DS421_12g380560 [Arachis hypogaea]|nr:uncharacterized protein DS421_12g380560 [Arachis hypogaea]